MTENEGKYYVRVESDNDLRIAIFGKQKSKSEKQKALCERIVESIKRHIDDVGAVFIEQDK